MPERKSTTSCSVKAFDSDSIGTRCVTLANPAAGLAPTRFKDGLSARTQLGKASLDRLVAAPQRVIFGIRDHRLVALVIGLVMPADFRCQPLEFRGGLVGGQRLDG